jgi:glycerophosphoryl diester phosphodiesterase
VAVTSGDWRFLFTSWQGWVLVLAGLAVLYAYIAFDLNVKVAYSGHVVRGEQVSLRRTVAEGVAAIRKFLCPSGLVVVLYIALLAPVVGVGLAIG